MLRLARTANGMDAMANPAPVSAIAAVVPSVSRQPSDCTDATTYAAVPIRPKVLDHLVFDW